MISARALQLFLVGAGEYSGKIDGKIGRKTRAAINAALWRKFGDSSWRQWNLERRRIAAEQMIMADAGFAVGAIDGIAGPQTQYALEQWQDSLRDTDPPEIDIEHQPSQWPRQSQVSKFYGNVGENQVLISPPYKFRLYDTTTTLPRISLHEKVAESAERVLQRVLDHYGPKRIDDLHLNRFFGSLNVRKMRGGSSYSMHSWGIAIDFDANRNQLRWGRDKAAFAREEYIKWWDLWYEEGWISLGRERNFDWMHVQAARL